MMNDHTLRLLDFAKIVESVGGYCLSEEGRATLRSESPLCDRESVDFLKDKVRSLVIAFQRGYEALSFPFPPVDDGVRILSKEGLALELVDLYALGVWSDSYGKFLHFMTKQGNDALRRRAEAAPDLSEFSKVAFSIMQRDGALRDLPGLREIRNRIRSIHSDIERFTSSLFHDDNLKSSLQSNEPTVRDGRTVLAVRANYRGRVKGIVHEVSSSGQTVFIEPEELVVRNNELVQEEARYAQELYRILSEASDRLRPLHEALVAGRLICAELDSVYARARHAWLTKGVFAENAEGCVSIYHARHPSLGSRAVPIDVPMPDGARIVVVTGPNTGGKTVTLKTVGLLALMNQFGLAVPAVEGTRLAVFDEVFADIGDEQSIDQSLSTFSGHMRVMSDIVKRATGRSLVLLDELGSGTDPEEGCAIAMSILDRFIERGATTILTTHHGILKNYGYTREGVINASVDFDGRTLSPTYRIVMGIPGESHAIDVASRNGIPEDLVLAARGYLDEERADISELIRGLSNKHRELEEIEIQKKRGLREVVEEKRKNDLKALSLKQKEAQLREQGVSELKRLLKESRSVLENLVRELREGELTREKTLKVKEFIRNLERVASDEEEAVEREYEAIQEEAEAGMPAKEFSVGDQVLVGSQRRRGKLVRKTKDQQWLVETDTMKLTVSEAELVPAQAMPETKANIAIELASPISGRALLSLDVRGQRLLEALRIVESQIDSATLAGFSSFEIIHGTGEGILSTGIHDFLKKCRNVSDYWFARPEEGGHGKTIVQLK